MKKELEAILPQLEEMRKRRSERKSQLVEVLNKIRNISKEIYRSTNDNLYMEVIDESDLSLKRLDELHGQLLALEKEKVLLNTLCCCTLVIISTSSKICAKISFNAEVYLPLSQ